MGSGFKSQLRRLFFFFYIFILLHGNAPVICKRGPPCPEIAETITFFLPFTALLKAFEDKRKSIITLFCPQSPNAPDIAQGRYCPRKSLPKHFPHSVCMITCKNHCHAIPVNVVGVGTNNWCINAHPCFRYFPKIGSPSPNF